MACGDKYSYLLQVQGRSADSPFGLWCSEPDAENWYGQARHVFGLVRAAWNALMRIEKERNVFTHTDAMSVATTAFEETFDALPEPSIFMAFGAWDCAEAVTEYIGNIRQGACVLEQLNQSLETYGAKGVDPGAGTGTPNWFRQWGGWFIGGTAVLLSGGVLWLAFRQPAPPPPRRSIRGR